MKQMNVMEGLHKLVKTGITWYLIYYFFWPIVLVGGCGACYVCAKLSPDEPSSYGSTVPSEAVAKAPPKKKPVKRKTTVKAKRAKKHTKKKKAIAPESRPLDYTIDPFANDRQSI